MAAETGKRKTSSQNTKSNAEKRRTQASGNTPSRGGTRTTAVRSRTTRESGRTVREKERRTTVRESNPEQEERDQALYHEISLIVLFVVLVILFCCNFGIIGPAGNAVSGFMFGIFGFLAYLFPILFFLGVLFWVANRGNPTAVRKLAAASVLFIMLEAICELVNGSAAELDKYDFQVLYDYSSKKKAGGGVLGGSVAFFFESNLGMIGAVLVIFLCIVVCGILVTEKSLLDQMKNGGNRIRERSREEGERRRAQLEEARERREEERSRREEERARREEERRQKEEEEQLLRMEKKVTGVTMDTSLKENEAGDYPINDIHEITYTDSVNTRNRRLTEPEQRTAEEFEESKPEEHNEEPSRSEDDTYEEIKIRSTLKSPADLEAEAAIKSRPPKEDEADYFRFHENLKMRGNNLAGILNEYGQQDETEEKATEPPFSYRQEPRQSESMQAGQEKQTQIGQEKQIQSPEKNNSYSGVRPVAKLPEPKKSTGPVSAQEGTLGQKAFEAAKPVAEYHFPSIDLLKKVKNNWLLILKNY